MLFKQLVIDLIDLKIITSYLLNIIRIKSIGMELKIIEFLI
jgi:hypothetical protein